MPALDTAAFKIFICYRRRDSEAYAGRLYDHLTPPFGQANVFMDVDALLPGQDWVEDLEGAVAASDVMLAVVGPGWLGASDPRGDRRLDNELDRVRIEIASALSIGIRVIPVLVGGASIPRPEELPDPLKAFARRQAVEIRHNRFASDAAALIEVLRRLEQYKQATAPPSGSVETSVEPEAEPPQPTQAPKSEGSGAVEPAVDRPDSTPTSANRAREPRRRAGPLRRRPQSDLAARDPSDMAWKASSRGHLRPMTTNELLDSSDAREFTGKTVTQALGVAGAFYGVSSTGLNYEILSMGSRWGEPARIRAVQRRMS